MPLELLAVFFFTSVLLGLTPGPDNLFVLSQSLVFGSRAGLLVTLGLCTGLIFHTSLVAFGIAAMIAGAMPKRPKEFDCVKVSKAKTSPLFKEIIF